MTVHQEDNLPSQILSSSGVPSASSSSSTSSTSISQIFSMPQTSTKSRFMITDILNSNAAAATANNPSLLNNRHNIDKSPPPPAASGPKDLSMHYNPFNHFQTLNNNNNNNNNNTKELSGHLQHHSHIDSDSDSSIGPCDNLSIGSNGKLNISIFF